MHTRRLLAENLHMRMQYTFENEGEDVREHSETPTGIILLGLRRAPHNKSKHCTPYKEGAMDA